MRRIALHNHYLLSLTESRDPILVRPNNSSCKFHTNRSFFEPTMLKFKTLLPPMESSLANVHPAYSALRQMFSTNLSDFTLGASLAKTEDPRIHIGFEIAFDLELDQITFLRILYHVLPINYPPAIVFTFDKDFPPSIMPTDYVIVDPKHPVRTRSRWLTSVKARFNIP